jgi:uncharacterized protein (TIGR03437 family)
MSVHKWFFLMAGALTAAPTITGVGNAASNRLFASPIAQGAIFIIQGSGLGPANISIASAAFQSTTLSNTSVSVTVGTRTVSALMYYTSATQVAALLPSNTPTGTGQFTVTYNGQTSSPVGHGVVISNVGIFTLDSSGQGPGIVTYPDYSLVSAVKAANCGAPSTACGAANPGDTLSIWATGLGPVSGSDAAGVGLGVNMPNVPLTVWLGGVQAPVVYQGRSGCCVGEDQIAFTVPANVPTGCAVPLVIQISGNISNSTVLPVSKTSRSCTLSNPALASIDVEQAVTAGPVTFGSLSLSKDFNSAGNGYQDDADFLFAKIAAYNPGSQPFFATYVDDQPLGTCLVYNNTNPNNNLPAATLVGLDAGASFTLKGPNGSVPMAGKPGESQATLDATGKFLVPGTYTITGTGGADVGLFSASITIPAFPTLASPLLNNFTVTRSNGMTVNWTANGSTGNVLISVVGALDNTYNTGATAVCTVAANAGTFTIPPYVMEALPPGNFGGLNFQLLTAAVPFTATGLSVGSLQVTGGSSGPYGFMLQ